MNHPEEETYTCQFCKKNFTNEGYKRHMKKHDGKKHFECNICGNKFLKISAFTRHMRTHTGEKPFSCEFCNKSFNHKGNCETHKKRHKDQRDHHCDICGKMFFQKQDLEIHKRIHSGEKPFSCEFCNKSFIQKNNCERHKKWHKEQRDQHCDVCGKKFSRKRNLEFHKRIHTGEKPFSCEFCNKSFSQKSNCEGHKKRHKDQRDHHCDICGKKFFNKWHLEIHKRIHTGEKPFSCEICKKSFFRKETLEYHLETHNREKKFVCRECNERFLYEKDWTTHIKSVHQILKPFECDSCEKAFTQKKYLVKHRRDEHKVHDSSCTLSEETISQIDNFKTSIEQHKGNMLPSEHFNQNIYSNGAPKNISSTTHSPDFTQKVSEAISPNAHLSMSITQHNKCNSKDINDDCRSFGTAQILTETSSADIHTRNQAHYFSSSGPCVAELPNKTAEWDHSWKSTSSSISKHFDDIPFSSSHVLSETAKDNTTANFFSYSENEYQSSILEFDYRTFIQEFGSLESQVSQNQQPPAEQTSEEEILNFLENGIYFEN